MAIGDLVGDYTLVNMVGGLLGSQLLHPFPIIKINNNLLLRLIKLVSCNAHSFLEVIIWMLNSRNHIFFIVKLFIWVYQVRLRSLSQSYFTRDEVISLQAGILSIAILNVTHSELSVLEWSELAPAVVETESHWLYFLDILFLLSDDRFLVL